MRHLLNLLLLVSFTTTTATAVALQSVSSIAATAAVELQRRAAAAGYPEAKVEIRPVDGRLNLAAAANP